MAIVSAQLDYVGRRSLVGLSKDAYPHRSREVWGEVLLPYEISADVPRGSDAGVAKEV